MALLKKLMCFRTQANFDEQLAAGEINDYSIVFIQDTQKIWTHQTYFGSTGDLSDYYTKNETYSKEEIDAIIEEIGSAINDLSDKVSELENSQVSVKAGENVIVTEDGNVYTISAEFDTSNLATKDELSDVSDKVESNSSNIENLQEQITEIESGGVDLTNYYTKGETNDLLDEKQDILSAGDNITITNNKISAKDTTYSAGSNVSISSSNAISVDLSNYATTSSLESGLATKQDTITAGTGLAFDGNTLNCTIDDTLFVVVTTLPSAPAADDEHKIHLVPLSTTGTDNKYAEYLWVDGAWEKLGELTTSTDLSGYYTSAQIDSLLSDKQDKLTAGSNISISGNTISATDTTYSGGSNVSISSSNVISVDLSNYVTSSSISTSLGNYLPLTGGTLSGELTVNAPVNIKSDGYDEDVLFVGGPSTFYGSITIDDYALILKGDYGMYLEKGSSASEMVVSCPIFYADAYSTSVTDPSSYDIVVAKTSDGKLEKSSFDTVKTAIVGDLEDKIDGEISDREAVIVSSEDDTYVLKQVDAGDNLLVGFKTNGEMDVPVGLSDDAYELIYALYEKLEKLSATVESLC